MYAVSSNTLWQVEEFKYFLEVVFTSDGRRIKVVDTRIGKENAILRELYRSVASKRKFSLSKNVKLSVFKSTFVPILTHDHESSVMIERMPSEVQAAEIGCLQRVYHVKLSDKVRRCEIREAPNVEPPRIDRSRLRWFGLCQECPRKDWLGKS